MHVASVLCIRMCWYLSRELFLTVCVIICYQVYKVFSADSMTLDGISRYRSVNFLVFVIFFLLLYLIFPRKVITRLYIIDIIVSLRLR